MIFVTITGADDATDMGDMQALSREFPFVEWGILFSLSRAGSARYPSFGWTDRLQERFWSISEGVSLSAHLCGEFARSMVGRGEDRPMPFVRHVGRAFCRVQVNGYEPGQLVSNARGDYEIILQARSLGALSAVCDDAARMWRRATVLYDPSGGRGDSQTQWPAKPPMTFAVFRGGFGYAGGIRPENVDQTIAEIFAANGRASQVAGDFWIDMESGVRTDDRLDLARVRDVLVRVATWNRRLRGES